MALLSCKQISELVSKSMDVKLPWYQRLAVRFHLLYCRACIRYRRQLRNLRKTLSQCFHDDEEDCPSPRGGLSDESKRRMKERLRRE